MPLTPELFKKLYEMQLSEDHQIAWNRAATAENLKILRQTNVNFARYTCCYSRLWKIHNKPVVADNVHCPHCPQYECSDCDMYYRSDDGSNDVSTKIISNDKGLSPWTNNQIQTLERGTDVTLEKVMFYAYIAQVPLSEILVLDNGYQFDEKGTIIPEL